MPKSQIEKEIKKLMKIPGKARGIVFITDLEYVKMKRGEEGVKILKEKMKEWGNPIEYEKIEALNWYPIGLRVISLLAIKEALKFGDEEIREMGNVAPKLSLLVKTLIRYFISLKRTWEESSKYWEKHYTVGTLEPAEFNEEKKYLTVRLKDFKIHPILCKYYEGYFLRISQYAIKSEKITIEETKCMFKGDPYHEFLIKWE